MRFRAEFTMGDYGRCDLRREFKLELPGYWRWHWKPWRYVYEREDDNASYYCTISWLCFEYSVFDWRGLVWNAELKKHVRIAPCPSVPSSERGKE